MTDDKAREMADSFAYVAYEPDEDDECTEMKDHSTVEDVHLLALCRLAIAADAYDKAYVEVKRTDNDSVAVVSCVGAARILLTALDECRSLGILPEPPCTPK